MTVHREKLDRVLLAKFRQRTECAGRTAVVGRVGETVLLEYTGGCNRLGEVVIEIGRLYYSRGICFGGVGELVIDY